MLQCPTRVPDNCPSIKAINLTIHLISDGSFDSSVFMASYQNLQSY